jgi:hypothetical protein
MIENPELAERVEKHGDNLAGSGRDLVILAVEFDVGTGVNPCALLAVRNEDPAGFT